jgi:hypothetical protein
MLILLRNRNNLKESTYAGREFTAESRVENVYVSNHQLRLLSECQAP